MAPAAAHGVDREALELPAIGRRSGGQITEAAAGQMDGHRDGAATGSRCNSIPNRCGLRRTTPRGCSLLPKGYGFGPKDEQNVGGWLG